LQILRCRTDEVDTQGKFDGELPFILPLAISVGNSAVCVKADQFCFDAITAEKIISHAVPEGSARSKGVFPR
jgi:hypothetical protein